MIFTSLSYKILDLDFISGLAWLKWKPLYSACGHQLCSLNLLGDEKRLNAILSGCHLITMHEIQADAVQIWIILSQSQRRWTGVWAWKGGMYYTYDNYGCSTHKMFQVWHVEKVHAVVARSTCQSQNLQDTPCSDHFWKLSCWKSARRCSAKHICKSKVQKTDGYGALLGVQMSFCVAGARDCAPCQTWAKR